MLKQFAATLTCFYNTSVDQCTERAKTTIQEIQERFNHQKVIYIPFGYAGGENGPGHSIPLKLFRQGNRIEGVFLNLGEGLQMHAEVDLTPAGPCYHFHSFPGHMDFSVLASNQCEEVFARLIRLKIEPCPLSLNPHSAEDVYLPFYSLCKIQSSFSTPIADRTHKSQLGDTCGIMAALLTVKDVCIDLGYSNHDIHRLMSLAKLTSILLFYKKLKGGDPTIDEWILLKNGIKEFAISHLKVSDRVLTDEEINYCHALIEPIFTDVLSTIEKGKKISLSDQKLYIPQSFSYSFPLDDQLCPIESILYELQAPKKKQKKEEIIIWETPAITPKTALATLCNWVEIASKLCQKNKREKAHLYCFSVISSLEVPHPEKKGFWDEVAEQEIPHILNALTRLAQYGIHEEISEKHGLINRNAILLGIGYAISDHLARRKWSKYLNQFASPFYPSRFYLSHYSMFRNSYSYVELSPKETFFEFEMLPHGPSNRRWHQVRIYFEQRQAQSKYTLFNLEDNCAPFDFLAAVNELRATPNASEEWSGIKQHFKFLEQFLENAFQEDPSLTLEEKLLKLWINEGDRYLPPEMETLYFFALCSWFSFKRYFDIPASRIGRTVSGNMVARVGMPKKNPVLASSFAQPTIWKEAQKMTENEIQMAVFKIDLEVRDDVLRSWFRIFSKPSLQISSVMLWIRHNLPQLSQKQIQRYVEAALFMPGLLVERIESEPSTIIQLRELIDLGIKYHSKNGSENLETLLFLIRLGIAIESYAPHFSRDTLAAYEDFLMDNINDKNKGVIYAHLLFIYQMTLPYGPASLQELINAKFWLAYHEVESVPDWLSYEIIPSPLDKHQEYVMEWFKGAGWKKNTLAEVLKTCFGGSYSSKEPCEGVYPIISQGEVEIDLETNGIFRESGQLHYLPAKQHEHLPLAIGNGLFWGEENMLYSPSKGLYIRFGKEDQQCEIECTFPCFQGTQLKDVTFTRGSIESKCFPNTLLADPEHYDHWFAGNSIIICKRAQNTPLYMIVKDETGFSMGKIDLRRGFTLSYFYLNVWEDNHPLSTWFNRFGYRKEISVWIDPFTEEVEEFEFLSLNISFKKVKDGFQSKEFPNLFLAQEQTIEALNFFNGALILKEGLQTHVILPCRQLRREEGNFTTHVSFGELPLIKDQPTKYFLYHLDRLTDLLIHPEPEANLFLTLLFTMQRNYEQAVRYLNRSHAFSSLKEYQWVFEQFYSLKDHSPAALAFYLRIGLFVINNQRQIILTHYQREKNSGRDFSDELTSFFKWLGDKYSKYIRVHASRISRVPSSIRLNKEEELLLYRCLKEELQKADKAIYNQMMAPFPLFKTYIATFFPQKFLWQGNFDIRAQLLLRNRYVTQIKPAVYLFGDDENRLFRMMMDFKNVFNTALPNLNPPSSFSLQPLVRYSLRDCQNHFTVLYERARQKKASLDLFYLMRSAPFQSKEYCAYYQLLKFVNEFPEPFATLKFGPDPDVNNKIFWDIVEIARGGFARMISNVVEGRRFVQEQRIAFNYPKNIDISLPPPPSFSPLSWTFSESRKEALIALSKDLNLNLLDIWFEKTIKPFFPSDTPFPFHSLMKKGESKMVRVLVEKLFAGYQKIIDPKYGKTTYSLKEGKESISCLNAAKALLEQKRGECKEAKTEAERIANDYPADSRRLGLRRIGGDLPEITMGGILTQAYRRKDPMVLRRSNPSLSPDTIEKVFSFTIKFHLLHIQITQLERAIEQLEHKGSLQGFAEAIVTYGEFDPTEEPGIILFQSNEEKSLRNEQSQVCSWEIATTSKLTSRVRLFFSEAGIGKTSVYTPFAMERWQQMGYLPISISTKPLYHSDREILKESLSSIYGSGLEVLEMNLGSATNASDFQRIYEHLNYHFGKKGFKKTPEDFYALHLKYQLALDQGDCERVKWLDQIVSLFEEKVAAIIDECQLNCSPFTQAKIAIGKSKPLPEFDRAVILEIYRAFVDSTIPLKSGGNVKERLSLHENEQATINPKEREEIKNAVLHALVFHPLFQIPEKQQQNIIDYWIGSSDEPKWMEEEATAQQVRGIDVVKIYFSKFFEKSMSQVWGMDYVRSLRRDKLYVPTTARQATGADFEEVYFVLLAAIQGTLQEGLDVEQVKELLDELELKHVVEARSSLAKGVTSIEMTVGKWVGEESVALHHASVKRLAEDQKFYTRIHKNTEAIFWYLAHILLKKVQSSSEQLTVTHLHLMHGCRHVTVFSADPGDENLYGVEDSKRNMFSNSQFLPHATQRFLEVENQQIITIPSLKKPEDFFKALIDQDPTIFKDLVIISDAGGMLRNFVMEKIVGALFEMQKKHTEIDYDGVVVFEEAAHQENVTELLVWLKEWSQPKKLKGKEINSALKTLGLNVEKMKLLILIDPSHRAGADIQLPKRDSSSKPSVLVLLGEGLTLSNHIQGAARGRGILSGEQRKIWGITQKLASTISPTLTAQAVLTWGLRNEAAEREKKLELHTFQTIDFLVAESAWMAIREEKDPAKQIMQWKKYRKGIVTQVESDLILRFKAKKDPPPISATPPSHADSVVLDLRREKVPAVWVCAPLEKSSFSPCPIRSGHRLCCEATAWCRRRTTNGSPATYLCFYVSAGGG